MVIGLIALAGLPFLLLGITKPHALLLITVWISVFAESIPRVTNVSALSWLDEILYVALVLTVLVWRLTRVGNLARPPALIWACLTFLSGLAVPILTGSFDFVNLLGAFYFLKGYVIIFVVMQLDWDATAIHTTIRSALYMALFTFVCGILNFVAPGPWSGLLSITGDFESRFGIPSLIGPFSHPYSFALFLSLTTTAIFAYTSVFRTKTNVKAFGLATGLFAILGLRRRLWVALAVGMGGVYLQRKNRASAIVASIVLTPLLLILSWDFMTEVSRTLSMEYLSEASQFQTARTVMTLDAVKLANSHAPLGVGFGLFGGAVAAAYYSPLYMDLGYSNIYGLTPPAWGQANFLIDTFWPSVIAETGWLGAIAYVGILVTVLRLFIQVKHQIPPLHTFLGTVGIAWLLILVIDSLAAPTFSTSLSIVFFSLAGIVASLNQSNPDTVSPPQSLRNG